jgi:hypothetical protein
MPANLKRQAWVGVPGRLRVIHDDVAVLAGVLSLVELLLQLSPALGVRRVGGPVWPGSQPLLPGGRGGLNPDPGRVNAGQAGPDAAAAFEQHDLGGLGGVPVGVTHRVPVEAAPAGRLPAGQRRDHPVGQHAGRGAGAAPARVEVVHVDHRGTQGRGEPVGQPGLARPGAAVDADQPGPAQARLGLRQPGAQLGHRRDRHGRHPCPSLARRSSLR